MNAPGTIVWFRRDLRLADNPALTEACAAGGSVIPVYIWAPDEEAPWAPGAASRWWLHHSLSALDKALQKKGSRLIIRRGPSLNTLRTLMRETGAANVFWNRIHEPAPIERDRKIKAELKGRSFNANLLHEPASIMTLAGRPYQVFTPFYKVCQVHGDPGRPSPIPGNIPSTGNIESEDIQCLELLPSISWDKGLRGSWTPGETGALRRLQQFAVESYAGGRDRPDQQGTSRLSPHLHFGEISPRQVWHTLRSSGRKNIEPYLRQLIWREFAHHLLFHFPNTPDQPLRHEFTHLPWRRDAKALKAWQRGRTGYPIVDAGMRQLWQTGWMHNRVRMIVASFLVKDLMISWQEGARWFWDTLVDADLANNTLGWQWAAGCGADAAPYFRIFNPTLQATKFDPAGSYVQRWASDSTSSDPIVEHAKARDEALAAYNEMRDRAASVRPRVVKS